MISSETMTPIVLRLCRPESGTCSGARRNRRGAFYTLGNLRHPRGYGILPGSFFSVITLTSLSIEQNITAPRPFVPLSHLRNLEGDAPVFVEVGEAGIAVDHAMRR